MFGINHVVAVGSVDGVLTTAAMLRLEGVNSCTFEFTQAFTVNTLNPREWESNRRVAFIDLAVNNRDPQMTRDFVQAVIDAGHKIVAVCDEHDAEAWKQVLPSDIYENLLIKPVSQATSDIKSSGALLLSILENPDPVVVELCQAANEADRMDFSSKYANWANKAIKSDIKSNYRRELIVFDFSRADRPSPELHMFIDEYDEILETHKEIVGAATSTNGLVQADSYGKKVDMITLMGELYKTFDPLVVALPGQAYDKSQGGLFEVMSFGVRQGLSLDVLTPLQDAGIPAFGFASKANVPMSHAEEAMQIIRKVVDDEQELCAYQTQAAYGNI